MGGLSSSSSWSVCYLLNAPLVHQLLSNTVHLLFAAEQNVFSLETAAAAAAAESRAEKLTKRKIGDDSLDVPEFCRLRQRTGHRHTLVLKHVQTTVCTNKLVWSRINPELPVRSSATGQKCAVGLTSESVLCPSRIYMQALVLLCKVALTELKVFNISICN